VNVIEVYVYVYVFVQLNMTDNVQYDVYRVCGVCACTCVCVYACVPACLCACVSLWLSIALHFRYFAYICMTCRSAVHCGTVDECVCYMRSYMYL